MANIWITLVGLSIPKCTVSLLPKVDEGDNNEGHRGTTPAVLLPLGTLIVKPETTNLHTLIYGTGTDTPGLFK